MGIKTEIVVDTNYDFFSIERVLEPDQFSFIKQIAEDFNKNAEKDSTNTSIRIIVRET